MQGPQEQEKQEPPAAPQAASPMPKGPHNPMLERENRGTIYVFDREDLKATQTTRAPVVDTCVKAKSALRKSIYDLIDQGSTNHVELALRHRTRVVPYESRFFFDVSVDDLVGMTGKYSDLDSATASPCVCMPFAGLEHVSQAYCIEMGHIVEKDEFHEEGSLLLPGSITIGSTLTDSRIRRYVAEGSGAHLDIARHSITQNPEFMQGYYGHIAGADATTAATKTTPRNGLPRASEADLRDLSEHAFVTQAMVTTAEKIKVGSNKLVVMPEEHGLVGYLKTNAPTYITYIGHMASMTTPAPAQRKKAEGPPTEQDLARGNYILLPEDIYAKLALGCLDAADKCVISREPHLADTTFYLRYVVPDTPEAKAQIEAMTPEERSRKRRIQLKVVLNFYAARDREQCEWICPPHLLGVWFGGPVIFDVLSGAELEDEYRKKNNGKLPDKWTCNIVVPIQLADYYVEELAQRRKSRKADTRYKGFVKWFIKNQSTRQHPKRVDPVVAAPAPPSAP